MRNAQRASAISIAEILAGVYVLRLINSLGAAYLVGKKRKEE